MQQDYFKNAIMIIKHWVAGDAYSIKLKEINELSGTHAKYSDIPEATYRLIALFDVQPENRQPFINAMISATLSYRAMHGNLEYNLYQYINEPNKFVVIEGWENKAYYKIQQKKHDIRPGIEGYLVPGPHSPWVVKDLSE